MNTNTLIFYLVTISIVTVITAYFFWKVLMAPAKKEPDSFSENDDAKRS